MIFRQYLHTNPVSLSYLFGCGGKQAGAVVDASGPIEPYMVDAERLGLSLLFVVDTHIHADHLSSGRRLAEATGAKYVLFHGAEAAQPLHAVRDRDLLQLGNVVAEVLHTPGHTPEHISLLVTDRTRAAEPWFVLTGHTLMVGDLGRTELAASAEDGARALFGSIQRLKALPDHVEVFPGAYSGSVCGRSLSGKPMSTIGFERLFNTAFRIEDPTEFVEAMLREIPEPPAQAAQLRAANAGRPELEAPAPRVCILDPDGDILRRLQGEERAHRDAAWACYHTDLFRFTSESQEFGIVGGAVGASYAVLVAEQLFVSGCELLISMTSAGRLAPIGAAPPYFVLIDRALRDEGVSYHYLPPEAFSTAPEPLLQAVDGAFDDLRAPVVRGGSWTTDAPFRETASQIESARSLGLLAVEMEAAGLYAFAKARDRRVLCFAHVTNQMGQAGDFEKGEADGAVVALAVISAAAKRLSP